MPELPEVETVRRGLERLIVGRVIASVSSDTPKSFPNSPVDVAQFVVGASVTAVHRRAKVLLIELSSSYTLVVHLKMTGQLVYVEDSKWKIEDGTQGPPIASSHIPIGGGTNRFGGGHPNDSLVGELPDKTTRVQIQFQDESKLFFNDQRKFGWMRLVPTMSVDDIDFMRKLGPEPLAADFTPDVLYDRLQRRKNTSVKAALLDQSVIAGIGNIYADESLWGARIHPATRVRDIHPSSIFLLHSEIVSVLQLSLDKGGSTDKNYVDAEGKRGSYLSFARVFRREGQPCPRCGTTIEKIRVAGRGTHICPHCQKLPS
jgi:formamidopyrimidine-DNA glycosylase